MRKHDVRKWLHAILDLLPVILIPVFMIYSHRHDVTENVQVTYKYQSNEVNSVDDLVEGNIYYLNELVQEDYYSILPQEEIDFDIYVYNAQFDFLGSSTSSDLNYDFVELEEIYEYPTRINICGASEGTTWGAIIIGSDQTYSYFTYSEIRFKLANLTFRYINNIENSFQTFCTKFNYLPQYTDYNVIESVDTTNSNVMDSFMNNFNNTIQKHFNMGNVFHLEEVYEWFNTNIFGGNAPVVIESIYNIVIYELVMDLLFLLYSLFMWFIDMIQKLMEKPLNSIK